MPRPPSYKFHVKREMAGSYRVHAGHVPTSIRIFQIPSYWVVQYGGKDIHFRLKSDALKHARKLYSEIRKSVASKP